MGGRYRAGTPTIQDERLVPMIEATLPDCAGGSAKARSDVKQLQAREYFKERGAANELSNYDVALVLRLANPWSRPRKDTPSMPVIAVSKART
jgi:hypothetical protein